VNPQILEQPSTIELEVFLQEHLGKKKFVQIAGTCEVVYVGRAASLTEAGDYVVMVKSDGSIQVHGARGVKPINWQPRTDDVRVARDEDDRLMLLAERFKPNELVQVTFRKVSMAFALELRDEKMFQLHGSEAQMHEALAQNPDTIEPGLRVLERELLVGVGGIDLYAMDNLGRYVIVEVKRAKATQEAVHQLERYVNAVREQVPGEVRGILAAPSISTPARTVLEKLGLEFCELNALPEEKKPVPQMALF
jgi:endonuclease